MRMKVEEITNNLRGLKDYELEMRVIGYNNTNSIDYTEIEAIMLDVDHEKKTSNIKMSI